ncbi:MAG: DUF1570 domain-containing protein [Planctomycetota bacterium]
MSRTPLSFRPAVVLLVLLLVSPAFGAASRPARSDDALLAELGPGFNTFRTDHFRIHYDTSRRFAYECSQLFERLYQAFWSSFRGIGVNLKLPEKNIAVIIFKNKESFRGFVAIEGADRLGGFYLQRANQIVFYDAGSDLASGSMDDPDARPPAGAFERLLADENICRTIHEAAHALCFNLHFFPPDSSPPRWFAEGVATLFETPRAGRWKGPARFNPERYVAFASARADGTLPSLSTLLTDQDIFFQTDRMAAAYGAAWTFTFFLYHVREKEFLALLEKVRAGSLRSDSPDEKRAALRDYEALLGKPLSEIETEWFTYTDRNARRHRREIEAWRASFPPGPP